MKTRHFILTLAVGTTLALGATAQAQIDLGGRSLPTTKASVAKHSTAAAQKEMRLRAQYLATLADFWKVHGPGGVAPGDHIG
jgi:hypothetical protein